MYELVAVNIVDSSPPTKTEGNYPPYFIYKINNKAGHISRKVHCLSVRTNSMLRWEVLWTRNLLMSRLQWTASS